MLCSYVVMWAWGCVVVWLCSYVAMLLYALGRGKRDEGTSYEVLRLRGCEVAMLRGYEVMGLWRVTWLCGYVAM